MQYPNKGTISPTNDSSKYMVKINSYYQRA